MKPIVQHHSAHYYTVDGEKIYKCPNCEIFSISYKYNFCPICGERVTFQDCRVYEFELFNKLKSRIKYRLSNIFMLTKNEDSTYNLLRKDGIEDKELIKKSKLIISNVLITFSEKKVHKTKYSHQMFINTFDFTSSFNPASKMANKIFKEFIEENKRMM